MTSGRWMVSESSQWVVETVAAAVRRQEAALQKVQNYRIALQTYSGTPEPVASVRRAAPAGSPPASGEQGQVPSLDDSFIQRIVELSDANIRYRQKLTDAMVDAQIEAVAEGERASYYKRLLQSAGSRGGDAADATDLAGRLDAIVDEGKKLTQEFNNLYDEFSRVALRASSSLYEARKPVRFETIQQYARRSLMNLVLLAFAGAAVLTFGFFAVRSRLRPEHR